MTLGDFSLLYITYSGVDMISEEGSKKENDIAKWEGKIEKSPTLSKLFT